MAILARRPTASRSNTRRSAAEGRSGPVAPDHGPGRTAHALAGIAVRGAGVERRASSSCATTTAMSACRRTSTQWGVPDLMGAFMPADERRDGRRALPARATWPSRCDRAARRAGHRSGAHGRRLDGRHDRPGDRRDLPAAHPFARFRSCRPAAACGLPMGKPEAVAMLSALPEGPAARAAGRTRYQAAHRDRKPGLSDGPCRDARPGRAQHRPPLLSRRAPRGSISRSWPRVRASIS